MATGPRYKVPFRRRKEGRTDYRARQRLLRSGVPRAVVRRSLKHTSIQLVVFDMKGDQVLAAANSKDLAKMGWGYSGSNLPSAYLTGYLAGKRALAEGIESAVLDIGRQKPVKGSVCFSALAGMVDAGLDIPHGEDVRPADERIRGQHIDEGIETAFDALIEKMEAD